MVVSEATRVRARRDKALATETSVHPEVQDALESSKASPHLVRPRQPEREAYVTVDALKNLMSMTDTIMQQVTEQVKKAMEVASYVQPLPYFDYVPTTGCEPSHWHAPIVSHRHSDEMREIIRLDRDGRSQGESCGRSIATDALQSRRLS